MPKHDPRPSGNPSHGLVLAAGMAVQATRVRRTYPKVLTCEQPQAAVTDASLRAAAADELAAVLIYCLSPGSVLELDLAPVVLDKLRVNEGRYPVDGFRGRYRKPERHR